MRFFARYLPQGPLRAQNVVLGPFPLVSKHFQLLDHFRVIHKSKEITSLQTL